MSKSTKAGQQSGAERRKSKRMDILDTFSLFVVVPAKGPMRLKVHDISDAGIGFNLDIEEEQGASSFEAKVGDSFEVHLYLNQSLYLPFSVSVRRIVDTEGVRRIGAEFQGKGSKGQVALTSFVHMLDALGEAARIEG
ncbi:MAG: PilZ domain-containing protein [Bdellovibrionia bacterium]